jgi:hypothetical protein
MVCPNCHAIISARVAGIGCDLPRRFGILCPWGLGVDGLLLAGSGGRRFRRSALLGGDGRGDSLQTGGLEHVVGKAGGAGELGGGEAGGAEPADVGGGEDVDLGESLVAVEAVAEHGLGH